MYVVVVTAAVALCAFIITVIFSTFIKRKKTIWKWDEMVNDKNTPKQN